MQTHFVHVIRQSKADSKITSQKIDSLFVLDKLEKNQSCVNWHTHSHKEQQDVNVIDDKAIDTSNEMSKLLKETISTLLMNATSSDNVTNHTIDTVIIITFTKK